MVILAVPIIAFFTANGIKYKYDKDWEEIVEMIARKCDRKDDYEFKKWLRTKEEVGYCFDYGLWEVAYLIQNNKIKKNNDHFTVLVGLEGSGKSTLASQFCALVSPTLQLKNCCFKATQLIENIKTCKRGDTIWVDEGALILFSRDIASKEQKTITQLFTVIRSKGFHICVCIPKIKSLNNYIREHRIDSLIHVTERGKYVFYSKDGVGIIIDEIKKGKRFETINVPHKYKYLTFGSIVCP